MAFDVIPFLRDNGIAYYEDGENVQRGWVGVRCPFCYDHSNHGGFNLSGGYFNCWRCGGHSVVDYVKAVLHLHYDDAQTIVDEYSTRTTLLHHLNEKKIARAAKVDLPGEPLGKFHRKYLQVRGFDPDFIESKYLVKGTGPVGKWKLRIMIPLIFHGNTVSYTGRDITGGKQLRYKTLGVENSVVNPKYILYGFDDCKEDSIVVVEGPFDVWRMGDGYCSGLGTTLTDQQLRLLSSFKTVAFLFDAEPEAQCKAVDYATRLSSLGSRAFVIDIEDTKDPADLSERRAARLKQQIHEVMGC